LLAADETPATAGYLIDPSGGTVLWDDSFNVDDQTVHRPLGFTASLFGTPFTEVDVSTNGNLNFSNSNSWTNQAFPTGAPMIAPLWDDLYIYAGTGQKITEKAAAGQYYSVTWDVSQFSNNLPKFQFQVVLFGGTTSIGGNTFLPNDIVFAYQRVDADFRAGDASVGLNKGDGTFSTLPNVVGSGGLLGNSQAGLLPTAPGSVLLARYDGSGYVGSLTTAVVPEPGTCILALVGLGCAGFTVSRVRGSPRRKLHPGCLRGIWIAFLATCALLAGRDGAADTVTLSQVDRGWYRSDGYHNPTNTNYLVGDASDSGDAFEYRNFFVFDLTSVTKPVVAASLHLYNPIDYYYYSYNGFGSDVSPGYERYAVFDVTTAVTSLTSGSAGLAGFLDLGSGTSFGDHGATSADNGTFADVPLNAAGVAALNAANGLFAVGGAITTLNGDWLNGGEMLFAYTGYDSTALILTVPEPSGTVLSIAGIVGIAVAGARRFRRPRSGRLVCSLLFSMFAFGWLAGGDGATAGSISYQYARRSLSGYAQASGYARVAPEVVREWGGTFTQSISGSSGVPGNYSAFSVSLDSNVPNDGSPLTASANWSSDWSLTPATYGESGGGVLHRVDLSVATTTDYSISGSITNGSVTLWTTGYQDVFPMITAGSGVTKTVNVQGTLNPGYYMMFWSSAIGGGASGTGHYDGAFNLTFAAVPEPSTCAMASAGIACAAGAMFRRRRVPRLRAVVAIA